MPIIDDNLVEEIIRGWRILDHKQHVRDYPCGAPLPDEIDTIVKTAFYASIQKEEASFITFSLMFLPTHKAARPRHNLSQLNKFLRFANPVEMTVEAVRKLAGANDEGTSALAVEKLGTQYLITGIIPFGRRPSPLSSASGGYPRPEALTVTTRSPGSLTISRAGGVIGRFVAGKFEMAKATPFHSKGLGRDLLGRVSSHKSYKEYEGDYWWCYASSLEHLLRSTMGRGHGGTIIWLPKEVTEAALDKAVFGYQLAAFSSVYDTFLEVLCAHKAWVEARHKLVDEHQSNQRTAYTRSAIESAAFPVLPDVKSNLITLLNTMAQIACVDGATLIDEYFMPMTFGARLQTEQWDGPIRFGPMPGFSSFEDIPRTRFGMRHNSAIDFVGAVPGSIAFVLSQDGPVRAITRRQDIVFIWPDCLSTVFVD